MLTDRFLPDYQFRHRHERTIGAPADRVFESVRRLDLGASPAVRWLLRLRGMPAEAVRLDGLLRLGFIELGAVPGRELLLGLVGRFWTLRGGLLRLDPDGFRRFRHDGYAKAVWSFELEPAAARETRLASETRVLCLGAAAERAFRRYWLVVRPFSAFTRRHALRQIQRQAEGRHVTRV